jgi:4-amino-4-deoxy-L-arabinose transferase-like glycosyltransferase
MVKGSAWLNSLRTTRIRRSSLANWLESGPGRFLVASVWLATMGAVGFLLRWPFLSLPMISDEGGYAYVAQRWLDGRGTLYEDIWVSRPQGIFLAYGAIMETVGGAVEDLRIGAWFISSLTGVLVWLLASRLAGRRLAFSATLIYTVLSSSPAIEGFTANAEVFMALPAAGTALFLLTAYQRGWGTWVLLSAGALAGLATIMKPSGIVMVPAALLFLWLATTDSYRAVAQRTAIVFAGFALGLAPFVIHGYVIGWDNFVFASVTYRITHQSSATNDPVHHVKALGVLALRVWPLLLAALAPYLLTWWNRRRSLVPQLYEAGLPASARMGIVPVAFSRRWTAQADGGVLLLQIWLLACLGGIAMGGDWWYHYLIQAAAPASIWFALVLRRTMPALTARQRFGLMAVLLLLSALPYSVLTAGNAKAVSLEIYGHPGYPDQIPVARYLQENSPPETPIFIAFDQAALYYLADRPSIYRYLYDQELRALPSSQAELIRIIESPNRPMYIVGTRQVAPFPDRGLAFWDTVGRYYHLEDTVRGVPIYRANEEPRPAPRFIPIE